MNRIEETETYLNMLQGKLKNEKTKISLHQNIQRIPLSYPYMNLTQWDIILRKFNQYNFSLYLKSNQNI